MEFLLQILKVLLVAALGGLGFYLAGRLFYLGAINSIMNLKERTKKNGEKINGRE